MTLRTPLGRVRGLGASGEGVHHWWWQRLTALALIPLSLWFVFAVLGRIDADHEVVTAWIATPWVTVLLLLYTVSVFYHTQLGLQVMIEDYIHTESVRLATLLFTNAMVLLAMTVTLVSILRVAL